MQSRNIAFPNLSGKRDTSESAMRGRHTRANLHAIVTNQALVFDSLRDIFYLLTRSTKLVELEKEYAILSTEKEILNTQVIALTEELKDVKNQLNKVVCGYHKE